MMRQNRMFQITFVTQYLRDLFIFRFENSQLFKMRDSLTFSLFTLFIRRCFFSLKNISDKIDFHVARQTC